MTSSWQLSQRKKQAHIWDIKNFADVNDPLGGWEDHYIINGAMRECHPDFTAIPIGNPYGFMVCARRRGPSGKYYDVPQDPIDPSQFNGYNKYQSDLYRPWLKEQIQMYDPYGYYDRETPNTVYLQNRDYIARDEIYNNNGIKPLLTPGPRKYHEYGSAYIPNPPVKYDISRLHQIYPQWQNSQRYHGTSRQELDQLDTSYSKRIV